MDSIVEENGNSSNNIDDTSGGGGSTGGGGGHNLSTSLQQPATVQATQMNLTNSNSVQPPSQSSVPVSISVAAAAAALAANSALTTTSNVVQYLPNPHSLPVQSVIQAANQSSVIQTAAGNNSQTHVAIPKGTVVYKNNATVIHTTSGNAVQLPPHFPCKIKPEPNTHPLDTNSEDSYTDDDSPRGRRELTRRPSYNKIYSEISGPDITGGTNLQMSDNVGIPALATGSAGPAPGTLIHLPAENTSTYYLSNRMTFSNNNVMVPEDQTRKREIRLQKNREAARECRRKKKEYIKCLENRVAVLENQNKALIEELKSLKELYCQTKND
ncbi:cyclic AMP response element-binding protein B isoform X1 [Stomoxys calcitrans]|uniref:cyclic AMP response element-binding protein B isoform X1 n=1 Tax=Stomoxys calcitrans TaxID=35570 RepID=UPI0027E32E46|nr:cyclic AMP response element-binding protein B isoform X1 [Stomoxys calcitrans]